MVGDHTIQLQYSVLANVGLKNCNFNEDTCDWNVDYELNGTEWFKFSRSTGEINEGTASGPTADHDNNKDSMIGYTPHTCTIHHVTAYFLWADAVLGKEDSETSLSSPLIKTIQKVCFNFWFDLSVSNCMSCIICFTLCLFIRSIYRSGHCLFI